MNKILYLSIAGCALSITSLHASESLTKKVSGWTTPGGTALVADGKTWTHPEIKKNGARENAAIGGDYDKPLLVDPSGTQIALSQTHVESSTEITTIPLLSFDHKDIWTLFQELSQLSEAQQNALIRLAEKSKDEEIEDLLLVCRLVAQSSGTIIDGLKKAKDMRTTYAARISRAIGLSAKDLTLLAAINHLTPSEILDKLSTLSTVDQQTLEGMIAQAPQAPTKDLEELTSRFEKIKEELGKFIALIEAMKTAREASPSKLSEDNDMCTIV